MSKIWSPTRPLCSPIVLGPGARTATRRSTGCLLIPVTPTPLAGLGSGTARLTETMLPTSATYPPRPISRHAITGGRSADSDLHAEVPEPDDERSPAEV